MIIHTLAHDQVHRILPLLHQVHTLHVEHQPERYPPLTETDDFQTLEWLTGWIQNDNMHCLVAKGDDALSDYAIYEIEHRPATPVRRAETRAMLHHVSVDVRHRRQGIGRALIDAMKTHLADTGVDIIATVYASFNDASARLMADAGLSPKMVYAEWRA